MKYNSDKNTANCNENGTDNLIRKCNRVRSSEEYVSEEDSVIKAIKNKVNETGPFYYSVDGSDDRATAKTLDELLAATDTDIAGRKRAAIAGPFRVATEIIDNDTDGNISEGLILVETLEEAILTMNDILRNNPRMYNSISSEKGTIRITRLWNEYEIPSTEFKDLTAFGEYKGDYVAFMSDANRDYNEDVSKLLQDGENIICFDKIGYYSSWMVERNY